MEGWIHAGTIEELQTHHARFDVCSGGTLDLWADDVPVHDCMVKDGEIWINPNARAGNQVQQYKE